MPRYVYRLSGRENESHAVDYETLDEARDGAVRYLGAYLAEHPGFAASGHWRVNVESANGQALLHVIVATVLNRSTLTAPLPSRNTVPTASTAS